VRIGTFDTDRAVLVVAEIGNNHEGDVERARALVRAAADCGAHAVKFQTFRARAFVAPGDRERLQRMTRFELPPAAFADLRRLASSLGLLFVSTPLDLESVATLEPLVDAYKIASGDNDFYPLIDAVCDTHRPLLVSTGLSDLDQVSATVQHIRRRWSAAGQAGGPIGHAPPLALLHCVSAYPAPPEEANLESIAVLRSGFGVTIGYSDHTLGIDTCVLAVAAGARIVEKHFTLDHAASDFRDHRLSADPGEMTRLVREVARVSAVMGTRTKAVRDSERVGVAQFRRSIAAAHDLAAGHVIAPEDLTWFRPADGLRPGQEHRLIGRPLRRDVAAGTRLQESDCEPVKESR